MCHIYEILECVRARCHRVIEIHLSILLTRQRAKKHKKLCLLSIK